MLTCSQVPSNSEATRVPPREQGPWLRSTTSAPGAAAVPLTRRLSVTVTEEPDVDRAHRRRTQMGGFLVLGTAFSPGRIDLIAACLKGPKLRTQLLTHMVSFSGFFLFHPDNTVSQGTSLSLACPTNLSRSPSHPALRPGTRTSA